MTRRDFRRPTFRTRGRATESITGSDVPSEFRTTPRWPRPKKELRREGEKALREFMARKPVPSHQQQLPEKVNILPPWDDDDPTPI
jgi:hypothetical protein